MIVIRKLYGHTTLAIIISTTAVRLTVLTKDMYLAKRIIITYNAAVRLLQLAV